MANLSWNVILRLMIALSSVACGFLTNVIDDVVKEDTGDSHLFEEKERERGVKERALEKLQEVFGLPDLGEKRHHQIPPQFMTELYNNIADESGVTRRKNPYNAKVVRSFIERDNSLCHYFYFNISGLDAEESVLEAQLRLYRMRTPPNELHPTFFTSPSLIIRVYQVLDEQQLGSPDLHRLLSSHSVGAHSHGWEVFNIKEAVLDWMEGRRPNKGLLVTCSTLFEQSVDVRFARRNEHHNSKQPILVLFDDELKTHTPPASPITDPRTEVTRITTSMIPLTRYAIRLQNQRLYGRGGRCPPSRLAAILPLSTASLLHATAPEEPTPPGNALGWSCLWISNRSGGRLG
ncbi:growth/differentiation factor 2-like isoform X2 [Zootermopsis nevadensis]|uniref:growth/differentiation factor 2-like isoform X2 n=1 Tax=Zootermopsis nevadensis TaxID=136037 RepID=UPI000B8E38C1|nr:growth/differentiation factor 2-like isoform X2 [Zootermopsis nevadensis]